MLARWKHRPFRKAGFIQNPVNVIFLISHGISRHSGIEFPRSQIFSLLLLGIMLAFSIMPGILALLKAVALLIYPLNQKRVDEIERELAVRRAAVYPEERPA